MLLSAVADATEILAEAAAKDVRRGLSLVDMVYYRAGKQAAQEI